jgi:hypothetical protein
MLTSSILRDFPQCPVGRAFAVSNRELATSQMARIAASAEVRLNPGRALVELYPGIRCEHLVERGTAKIQSDDPSTFNCHTTRAS